MSCGEDELPDISLTFGTIDLGELTCGRIDDEAAHAYRRRNEWMVFDQVYGFTHALFAIAESGEPILEIDAAIVHQFDMVARNACIEHMRDHFFGIHMLRSAIAVTNHHDILHA